MTTDVKYVKTTLTRAPTDGSGVFEGQIFPYEIDHDHERVENFVNVPARIPLVYSHLDRPGEYSIDPAARIGTANVTFDRASDALRVRAKLDHTSNAMAAAVYERLLLPADDPHALRELSIGFLHDGSKSYTGPDGERVLVDVRLIEISVVHRGAQRTDILNVKSARERDPFPHKDDRGRFVTVSDGRVYADGTKVHDDGRVERPDVVSGQHRGHEDLVAQLDELEGIATSTKSRDPAVSAEVDALIAQVRAEVRAEKAEAENREHLSEQMRLQTPPEEVTRWERERRERQEVERVRLDQEKKQEANAANLADKITREHRNWGRSGDLDWYSEPGPVSNDAKETYRLPAGGEVQ